MKKCFITMLVALAACTWGFAQEKMKVELKNGSVVSYNVEDVNRFYFVTEGEGEQLAANCEITLLDELALTTQFAMEVNYGSAVEYILIRAYRPEADADQANDADLVADLLANGSRIENTTTVITGGNMPEGVDLTIVCAAYDAQGKRGPLFRHHLITHKSDQELLAPVTSCKYNDQNFFYTIEIDDSKVLRYYLLEELGSGMELMNNAALGLAWRQAIAEDDTHKGEYYSGKSFTTSRPNGEPQLYLATWAVDFNEKLSGNIFADLYYVNSSSARVESSSTRKKASKGHTIEAFSKVELQKLIKSCKYRIVETK